MFGTELLPLMKSAQRMILDSLDSQIEDAKAEMAAQQRKVKRLKAQRGLVDKMFAEIAKPPKPFKPVKLTKTQRKRLEQARRAAIPTGIAVGL